MKSEIPDGRKDLVALLILGESMVVERIRAKSLIGRTTYKTEQ